MKILIACELSGTVRDAFEDKGHDAWSCDIEPTDSKQTRKSGKHIQGNIMEILSQRWDMMIAFPPCTYLTYAATRHWNNPGRAEKREAAMEFFMSLVNANIDKICIENPVGYPNTVYRKPDQIIHPYYFGDPFQKRTCFWLKGLSPLDYRDTIIDKPAPMYICNGKKCKGKAIGWTEGLRGMSSKERSKARSKTFQGIADAMAEQWG